MYHFYLDWNTTAYSSITCLIFLIWPKQPNESSSFILNFYQTEWVHLSFSKISVRLSTSFLQFFCFKVLHFAANVCIFSYGPFPSSFSLFSSFQQLTFSTCSVSNFADNRMRTADLWCGHRLLCQLSHNHCPSMHPSTFYILVLKMDEPLFHIKRIFEEMDNDRGQFLYNRIFSTNLSGNKIQTFNGMRTRIIRVEGNQADR